MCEVTYTLFQFHLEQARLRSELRIKNNRANPIDLLAYYIHHADDTTDTEIIGEPLSVVQVSFPTFLFYVSLLRFSFTFLFYSLTIFYQISLLFLTFFLVFLCKFSSQLFINDPSLVNKNSNIYGLPLLLHTIAFFLRKTCLFSE